MKAENTKEWKKHNGFRAVLSPTEYDAINSLDSDNLIGSFPFIQKVLGAVGSTEESRNTTLCLSCPSPLIWHIFIHKFIYVLIKISFPRIIGPLIICIQDYRFKIYPLTM